MSTATTTFNGWANWETWNVALWIQNDEDLYNLALCRCLTYKDFQDLIWRRGSKETPDGCLWSDPAIDHDEINAMIADL